MSQSVVASRYATALFELAKQQGQTEVVQHELKEVKKSFQLNKELSLLLNSPRLSLTKKKGLLADIFQGASEMVMNTLYVLLDANRLDEIVDVCDAYQQLANDAAGIAEAKVYSTRPLTAEEQSAISSAFAKKIGKQSLDIENIIDPKLIGGIRLQIGNNIYDSSLSGKLANLQRQLIGS